MGRISIDVPGDMNLKYEINDLETIEKIIRIIKISDEQKSKKKSDHIVGIWRNRNDENIPSENIQKELREKTWKRF